MKNSPSLFNWVIDLGRDLGRDALLRVLGGKPNRDAEHRVPTGFARLTELLSALTLLEDSQISFNTFEQFSLT